MSLSFIRAFEARGERPALVLPGNRVVTYADLARRVASRAALLGGGRRLVAIEAGTCEHAIVTYLAALSAGHAVALLPPGQSSALDAFCEDFRPETVCRLVDGRWRMDAGLHPDPQPLHPDLALLLSTSGSTGISKSVRLSAAAIEANARSIADYLRIGADDRGLLLLPLHYSYGLSVLHSHLAVGASLFVPRHAVLDTGFADDISAHGVTNIAGVPFSYDLFERIGLRDHALPALRFMTVAGGRLSPDLIDLYRRRMEGRGGRFFVMYGQTEATARIAYVPPEHLAGHEDCIGIAIPGGRLALAGDDGAAITRPGMTGELVYSGPNVMMGYAGGRADLSRGHETGDLRTGDLAERTADGLYRVVGRLKRFSKIAGLRIAHDAVEQALARSGLDVVVTGTDSHLTAFFTAAAGEGDVRARLAEASGLTLLHVSARRIAAFPRNASGKIDYAALAALSAARPAEAGGVREAFRRAFFPKIVGDDDSFVALGGDSLRFVELSLGLEQALGALPDDWDRMTVGALAAREPQTAVLPRVGADIALRVFAILLVVLHHEMLWPIPGGSALMLVLVGFSLARFQQANFAEGDWKALLRPLVMVFVPYAAVLAGYALAWGAVPWASVFLVGNFGFADPVRHTMLPYLYWFVELFTQILLLFAVLSFVPCARTAVARNPFAAGLFVLAFAVFLRFSAPLVVDIGNRQIFTLYWNLHLVAFGWCAWLAPGPRSRALLATLAAALFFVLGFVDGVWIGTTVKYLVVFSGFLALLFLPALPVPRWLFAALMPVAAASYHIYLFHRLVPEVLMAPLHGTGIAPALFHGAAILGGLAAGIAVWALQRVAVRRLAATRLEAPAWKGVSRPGAKRALS
ncbi:AMP-binding protein [Shinella zoogloeoides]|uniref:AMP-binding protein n=1 Tax=Shinella zoogloeoides TaxID=352475 RepID=A0A6N8TE45_SHIZO|nr:AMP-binding protein [Shinella zoogloeoides]MXO00446.1 AMP-binding protein [Shinella zoogloeoides]UEX83959.1 AMP-binding protein [Shinella zoogloeoides]